MTVISTGTENEIPRELVRREVDLGSLTDIEDMTLTKVQAYFKGLEHLYGEEATLNWIGMWDGPHKWVIQHQTPETDPEYTNRVNNLKYKNQAREAAIQQTRKRDYEQYLRLKEKYEGPNAYAGKPEED